MPRLSLRKPIEWLETHEEVPRLNDPARKIDLTKEFHKEFAQKLKDTLNQMFKDSPSVIVSDHHHFSARSDVPPLAVPRAC